MEFHLERKIRLCEESEFKNLYEWSLQETDENGDQMGGNKKTARPSNDY